MLLIRLFVLFFFVQNFLHSVSSRYSKQELEDLRIFKPQSSDDQLAMRYSIYHKARTFHHVIPNIDHFYETYFMRFNEKIKDDFIAYFLEKTIPEPHEDPSDTAPDDNFSLEHANRFCCDCFRYNFNCPICRSDYVLGDKIVCEYPFRKYSPLLKRWYLEVFLPNYNHYKTKSQFTRVYTTGLLTPWIRKTIDGVLFQGIRSECTCEIDEREILYDNSDSFGVCNYLSSTGSCEESIPKCNFEKFTGSFNVDRGLYVCYSNRDSARYKIPFAKGTGNICTREHLAVDYQFLSDYWRQSQRLMTPRYLGINNGNATFLTNDFKISRYIVMLTQIHSFSPLNYTTYFQRTYGSASVGPAFNNSVSLLGDIILHSPCSTYLPYKPNTLVCQDALLSNLPYSTTTLFREGEYPVNEFSIPLPLLNSAPPEQITTPSFLPGVSAETPNETLIGEETCNLFLNLTSFPFNFTCKTLSNFSDCAFKSLLNSTFKNYVTALDSIINQNFSLNLDKIMNKTLDSAFYNLLRDLGSNDSRVIYAPLRSHENGTVSRMQVGNWFSGIFGVLIDPFFEAFTNIVLKAFIPPFFEAITSVIESLSELIIKLTEQLLNFLKNLADSISRLIIAFLNLIIGLIVVIESRILLFEYIVLFLFILLKIKDDPVFAGIVVLIFVIVFGVTRKSPSFLIPFVNNEYVLLFGLEDYFNKTFDYSYSISFRYANSFYIFYLHNSTFLSYEN